MVIWERIYKTLEQQDRILKDMTSMAGRGGKKVPALTTASPAQTPQTSQRQIDEMLPTEKGGTMLQNINTTVNMVQDTMMKLQELITQNHIELKTDLHKLDTKVDTIQEAIEQRVTAVEKKAEQNEKEIERVDQKMTDLETAQIHTDMERASYFLRFQNIIENREEDLEEVMTEIISNILQRDRQEIEKEIDEIYRLNTNYARRYHLPREIHVKFARKKTRDQTYLAARGEKLTYKGKEINILKQIPRRVRDLRREFRPLANALNRKNITFRWLVPAGMLVTWEGKKLKVVTLEQAQELYAQLEGTEEELETGERMETTSREEGQESREDDRGEGVVDTSKVLAKTVGVKTRNQTAVEAAK